MMAAESLVVASAVSSSMSTQNTAMCPKDAVVSVV
jgi:hypothetical protein